MPPENSCALESTMFVYKEKLDSHIAMSDGRYDKIEKRLQPIEEHMTEILNSMGWVIAIGKFLVTMVTSSIAVQLFIYFTKK